MLSPSFSCSVYCSSLKPISFCFNNNNKAIYLRNDVLKKYKLLYSSSLFSGRFVCWVEKESQQQGFEVDPDEAREALKQLDQQLQSLSQKQVRSPKIKASDVNLTSSRENTIEDVEEFSGSFLAYTAGALFLLTILYNVFFYTVIKPSIDGPEEAPTGAVERQITNLS